MEVYVNDKPVHLSTGMTVKHALTQTGLSEMLEQGKKIYDEWENELGLDGALREGAKIFVK
jgi:sulfur carrier protein ThiS